MVNISHPELAETKAQPLPPASLEALKQMREELCSTSSSRDFKLQPNQRFLRRVLSPDSETRNLLMIHGTGVGKCHGLNTPILMFDGSIKMVQDVVEGDLLMGDDSTPRRVISLARGRDQMYRIIGSKGDSYTVNSEHILCLKMTGQHSVTEIEVKDYLKLSKKIQRNLKGYRTGIDFVPKEVDFDPYVLGVWLGDGCSRDPIITSQDSEILLYLRNFCAENGLTFNFQSKYNYRVSSLSRNHENTFLTFLKKHNLINNKHIPDLYKINSRHVRLQVLAGLIDTDGYLFNKVYEITQKSEELTKDIVFLARSLGFSTITKICQKSCVYKGERRRGFYYRTNICGHIDEIPVRILRKKSEPYRHNKDPLKYGITVTSAGEGDYYGFVIDGNHRYVLGDFTVTHNTCTAIQIAEEYIVRPEFQSKKVLVLANPSIRENFKTQIFDISRVTVDADGLLLSKQCTGRRYLEMIQRSQSEPLRYTDRAAQSRVMMMASKLIGEFYEFMGYDSFANMIDAKQGELTPAEFTKWIHDTFDNRLIIVDEAHNLKVTTETEVSKLASLKVQDLIKTANGITLVLLTATPMFDTYDEVLFYINLFLWNDRRIDLKTVIKPSDIFDEQGNFKEGKEDVFRGWCQDYISFVKGENPFTFPFRLPPPDELVAPPNLKLDSAGKPIEKQRKYLTLTASTVSPTQAAALKGMTVRAITDPRLICVYPENKSFRETFDRVENAFKYKTEKFLAPSKVAEYSSKFGLIMDIITKTTGIVFVYSNIVEGGAQLFAMCLEEHGFESAMSPPLLKDTSNEVTRGSRGKYVLFTSESSDAEIKRALVRLKRPENADGSDIRVVIASPKVSEGVDFRYVRQVHILDPWFNMSRLEQVIGRGMRTCSHALLPFEQQNCTVYLHVCRLPEGEMETVDENIYRAYVEAKAEKIAKVKRVIMESAMDCSLQLNINSLPEDWREGLEIPQIRSQDNKELRLTLADMSAPTFEAAPAELQCKVKEDKLDPQHERPLSAILDVKDEVLDKILKLIVKKPVWKKVDLYGHSSMKQYTPETVSYILQSAIDSGFPVKDSNGRVGTLESKGEMIAFAIGEHDTLFDKLVSDEKVSSVEIPEYVEKKTTTEEEKPTEKPAVDVSAKREAFEWPPYIKKMFDESVLNWYIVDTVLTSDEKINHFLSLNWESPPPYAAPLITETKSGKKLYILGASKIYNEAKEKITPIGEELDAYKAWVKKSTDNFVSKKTDLFASMKDHGIIFNLDEKSVDIKRAARAKTIGGRMCTTYKEEVLNAFSKWLNGEPFPEQVKTKKDRCMYLDLLVRKSVLTGKQGLMWITPEEFEIYSADENRADLLKRLKD